MRHIRHVAYQICPANRSSPLVRRREGVKLRRLRGSRPRRPIRPHASFALILLETVVLGKFSYASHAHACHNRAPGGEKGVGDDIAEARRRRVRYSCGAVHLRGPLHGGGAGACGVYPLAVGVDLAKADTGADGGAAAVHGDRVAQRGVLFEVFTPVAPAGLWPASRCRARRGRVDGCLLRRREGRSFSWGWTGCSRRSFHVGNGDGASLARWCLASGCLLLLMAFCLLPVWKTDDGSEGSCALLWSFESAFPGHEQ
jgi:hypothetical protein